MSYSDIVGTWWQGRASERTGSWSRHIDFEVREKYRTKGRSTVILQVMMALLGLSVKDNKEILLPSWQHGKIPDYKPESLRSRGPERKWEVVPFKSTLLCTASDWEEKVYPQISRGKKQLVNPFLIQKSHSSVWPCLQTVQAKIKHPRKLGWCYFRGT